jgi:hypothetical protein
VRVEASNHGHGSRLVCEILHGSGHQFRQSQREYERTHDFETHARPACGEENPADKRNAQQCQRYWPTQRIDHSENRSNRLGRIVEPAD